MKFKPKGGFVKKTQKCRWVDQVVEEGNEAVFSADITEPVELGSNPKKSAPAYCPGEVKGKFNGIVSGIRPSIGEDQDSTLKCTYVKREFVANSSFTQIFTH